MIKPTTPGGEQVTGETVPPDIVAEYARELSSCTPEDFARQLESSGMVYRSDPSSIAEAAKRWVRAGYQPW